MKFLGSVCRSRLAPVAFAVACAVSPALAQSLTDFCGADIRVGLRDDAAPFSYAPAALLRDPESDETGARCGPTSAHFPKHAGFTVAICATFFDRIAAACSAAGESSPRVVPVPLKAKDRTAALMGQPGTPEIDLLCGATTATVWLSGRLPHTLTTFITPTRALLSENFGRGAGQCRIGVVRGTTSARDRAEDTMLPGWRRFVQQHRFCGSPDAPPPISHASDDYPTALRDLFSPRDRAESDILIADLHILQWYQANAQALRVLDPDSPALRLAQRSFTLEPYAIIGGQDDAALVTLLNLHIAAQQRDGTFRDNLSRCFGRRLEESFVRLLDIQERTPLGLP